MCSGVEKDWGCVCVRLHEVPLFLLGTPEMVDVKRHLSVCGGLNKN